jgi:hypothetical protein
MENTKGSTIHTSSHYPLASKETFFTRQQKHASLKTNFYLIYIIHNISFRTHKNSNLEQILTEVHRYRTNAYRCTKKILAQVVIGILDLWNASTYFSTQICDCLGPASFQSADHCFKCRLSFTCVDYLNGDFYLFIIDQFKCRTF